MALSSGSPVSEDVWVLIKMCRASGDATPTSTTTPPLFFLLLRSLLPSVHGFLSFHVPAFSLHFPYPPLPSQTPRFFYPTSFPPLLLLLSACVRSHAKRIATLKLNRGNATWTTAAVSCTRIRFLSLSFSLSLCLSVRTHAEDVSSLPADPGGSVFLPANP